MIGASGEYALLRALLLDAIQCLAGEGSPRYARVHLAHQARTWVARRDASAPFSFENVCTWLDLPTDRIRRKLLRLARSTEEKLDAARVPRRSSSAEIVARAARNTSIRALRDAGVGPGELAERFGLSYESIIAICASPRPVRRSVA